MDFLLTKAPEFKPRKHIGLNPNLNPEFREVLEVLDVMEQREEWAAKISIQNRNWILFLAVVFALTNWANIKRLGDNQVERAGGIAAVLPAQASLKESGRGR